MGDIKVIANAISVYLVQQFNDEPSAFLRGGLSFLIP